MPEKKHGKRYNEATLRVKWKDRTNYRSICEVRLPARIIFGSKQDLAK